MAKNKEHKKCIHCLETPEEITEDHVIPQSWYSTILSKNVPKPTAPSCLSCNNKLGKQEKEISHLMWACMPEDHPMRPELAVKLYRACGMGPSGSPLHGLDKKELGRRMAYCKKLLSMTEPAKETNTLNIFPGFGFHPGYPKNTQRIVKIDPALIVPVAEKVVRGLEYIQQGRQRYIEKPYKLEVFFPKPPHPPELEIIRKTCRIFSDGTNTIQRGFSPNNPLEPIYIIRLWNQWEIWGVIKKEN